MMIQIDPRRADVLENYLRLSREAQEIEYMVDNSNTKGDDLFQAQTRLLEYYASNGITRQELDRYHNMKRKVKKVDGVSGALAAMDKFFS